MPRGGDNSFLLFSVLEGTNCGFPFGGGMYVRAHLKTLEHGKKEDIKKFEGELWPSK